MKFELTPDPGVLEVNVQPTTSWQSLSELTTVLYEQARQVGLSTENSTSMVATAAPAGAITSLSAVARRRTARFLRRPDLLRSLLAYWNNHPSLSYLFSGSFIGPTSQAPRVDEARQDALAELELAFRQVGPDKTCAPWLADRLFRHLLVDVTGNTHRAEFCIDKLYNPEVASGRQGILELRNFEMPPHARMSLAQQLLVRALVAMVWRTPYQHRLVRWGTGLARPVHAAALRARGSSRRGRGSRDRWLCVRRGLVPAAFRIPFSLHRLRPGALARGGAAPRARTVARLGEQGSSGGTARYVDSSLERLQVQARNLTDGRHVILCNGRPLPMTSTGRRANSWRACVFAPGNLPNALHPNIGVHAPLVFDVFDTWNGRAVGGCTYHVSHPGGLSFDTRPSNALVAESRRKARFLPFGHTPGPGTVKEESPHPLFPLTLDLRR
jgi:uncharacterized protein (DUF2126 family)